MKKLLVLLVSFCGVARADTETINWYVDGSVYNTSTCESGADLIIPATPTKRGYHFVGWDLSDYTQLDYIESTGTQYIDTGIIPTANTNVKLTAQFTGKFTGEREWNGLIGSRGEDNASRFYPIGSTSRDATHFRFVYGNTSIETMVFDYIVHTVDFNNSSKLVLVDGVNRGSTSTGFTKSTAPLCLFAINHATEGIEWYAKARIYEYSVYENGVLVQNLIPCKRPSGIVGMCDTVTNTFFTNQGTGDFIAGPVSTNQTL